MGVWQQGSGPKVCSRKLWGLSCACAGKPAAEPAGKPGSVVDSHSSRPCIAAWLQQPTRSRRGSRHGCLFGLAPDGVCRADPLPDSRCALTAPFHPYRGIFSARRYLSVALSVGSRRPGVTWHRALWSPDFPRHQHPEECDDATAWPTPSRALSHGDIVAPASISYLFRGCPAFPQPAAGQCPATDY